MATRHGTAITSAGARPVAAQLAQTQEFKNASGKCAAHGKEILNGEH